MVLLYVSDPVPLLSFIISGLATSTLRIIPYRSKKYKYLILFDELFLLLELDLVVETGANALKFVHLLFSNDELIRRLKGLTGHRQSPLFLLAKSVIQPHLGILKIISHNIPPYLIQSFS